jgi:hypothetical protein
MASGRKDGVKTSGKHRQKQGWLGRIQRWAIGTKEEDSYQVTVCVILVVSMA